MSQPWYRRLTDGLARTREQLGGQVNVLLRRGPDLDETFWAELEDALIGSDMGVTAVMDVVDRLKESAARHVLPDAEAVIGHLSESIAEELTVDTEDFLSRPERAVVLIVGVNGTGKTTSVGKLGYQAAQEGRSVLIGSADTYRAAAIEQLDIWAERAGVPVVKGERGSDPASVAFDAVARANAERPSLTLIDTAGRLHTSTDLMAELQKVQRVVTGKSDSPVKVLLVIDATTGQNGLAQARRFHEALAVDGVVLTKLDGTAKGGIAVAVVRDLGIPILRVGVGEGVEDLRPFSPQEFAQALTGLP